ncbi:MAG: glycerol-3-phosphate dehydrogenase/oxidase [Acidobacteria bacterium]|jgi:glycerol-3-phosphate dehydrogenase|nr:glycerol-3-phosphate dehydrogenase/oxidase [Acidobacteriota bacterium]
MNRAEMLNRVREREKIWDIIVIGGGATGVGCAVDAASRGFDVLLLEQNDFGKGTSSRSTKLIHGGVRYLASGSILLVREALKERGILQTNAPHLVKELAFVVPYYSLWQKFFYGAGLKIYNLLSGKYGFGKSRILSKKETIENLPNIRQEDLRGGVLYFDGQFDDTRLLINLVSTAVEQGAAVLNYARVFQLTKNDENLVDGVDFQDAETGEVYEVKAKVIINAAGAFCDEIRKLSNRNSNKIIAPSQGIHLVFNKSFLPGENALMIPKTSDGRVLFAIPWHDKTLIGTTDTPIEKAELEPQAFEEEIRFILKTVINYLAKPPQREDVLSVFVGIRPLVKSGSSRNTAKLSRDYTIEIDKSNLLTITGGKWTTYRKMAEDAVNQAVKIAGLSKKISSTKNLKIHGFCQAAKQSGDLAIYGADAVEIEKLIEENPILAEKLHKDLPYCSAEIVWSVRREMAQTVEDVLARRTRALFLDTKAAIEIAPAAAEIMAKELGKDEIWTAEQINEFNKTAKNYLI